ncbi:replication-associated recombination protein A [Patescibacteria group bacterium]|nr:replication-associated recombination protein A [Patescibacteria group bacterium]
MFDGLPLAAYLRPKKLNEVVGQKMVLKADGWLLEAIKNDSVPSLIFWGPPGSGKTTLASLIAKETKADFIQLSATESGVKDLKAIVDKARSGKRLGVKTILFIDEIHRWNKSQQDALLPQVENGVITLIGATTENPSFAVNGALLSRVKVVVLEALNEEDLLIIVKRAAKTLVAKMKANSARLIARLADGDARRAIGLVETAAAHKKDIDVELIKEIINKPNLLYDKSGEEHYNLISALHKSMRGNNENASLYYLARMLEAGEDPLYIARRLVRFASEDVGLANNSALLLATAVYDACKNIGMPECGVHLAHAVTYLAKATKSIDVYQAFNEVMAEVRNSGNLPVPLYLRNAPTKLMKNLGYGKDYKYTPLEDDSNQEYLPEALKGKKFFRPKK